MITNVYIWIVLELDRFISADGSTMPTTTLPPGVTRGTTEDPCKDSGDLDCKEMDTNLNICANKAAPPVVLYCPKYCGLC